MTNDERTLRHWAERTAVHLATLRLMLKELNIDVGQSPFTELYEAQITCERLAEGKYVDDPDYQKKPTLTIVE